MHWLLVGLFFFASPLFAQSPLQQFIPQDPVREQTYGYDVEVLNGQVFIGSPGDSRDVIRSGSVDVLSWNGGIWERSELLKPPQSDESKGFGRYLAAAGEALVVRSDERIYVFEREAFKWEVTASWPHVGPGELIARSGEVIVKGSPGNDIGSPNQVRVFRKEESGWEEIQVIAKEENRWNSFGADVCFAGDDLVISAPRYPDEDGDHAGALFVYRMQNGAWEQVQEIVPASREKYEQFGRGLECTNESLVVHAYSRGKNYLFSRQGDMWVESGEIVIPGDNRFLFLQIEGGSHLFIQSEEWNDSLGLNGGWESYVYVWLLQESGWTYHALLRSPNPQEAWEGDDGIFGFSIAMGLDVLVIAAPFADGAPGLDESGEVYIFDREFAVLEVEQDLLPQLAFEVYPNPASTSIHIELARPGMVWLHDSMGREVRQDVGRPGSVNRVDISTLRSGVYWVRVCEDASGCRHRPFTIVR